MVKLLHRWDPGTIMVLFWAHSCKKNKSGPD